MKNILNILPYEWQIKEISSFSSVSDIRIKAGQPLILFKEGTEKHIEITPTLSQLSHIVQKASENSVYSYIDDIRQGFITLKGGHRMGISGKAVYESESLTNIKNVCGINIRIARELKGVASEVFLKLISDGRIHNTVIISPPGGGKTTLLRDMARISGNTKNQRPVLIDSRYEIAAEHKGEISLDVGERTLTLSGYRKSDGFSHAIRTLSPTVILCDETGSEDSKYLNSAVNCGVSVIVTAHAASVAELSRRMDLSPFKNAVILDGKERKAQVTQLK